MKKNKLFLITMFLTALAAFGTAVAHAAAGGPDAAGYTFVDSNEIGGPAQVLSSCLPMVSFVTNG